MSVHFFLQTSQDLIINKGINSNSSVYPGCLPLHLAVTIKDVSMVNLLLEHKADCSLLEARGLSQLDLLIEKQVGNPARKTDSVRQKKTDKQ